MASTKASNPNGIVGGIAVNALPLTITNPGEIIWVNSSTVLAKGGAPGRTNVGGDHVITGRGTYKRPFATITQGLNAAVANRGDIVLVMPGYTENVIIADGLAFNKAGTAVVGLGRGSLKPTITVDTATSADVNLSADDMLLHNLRFASDLANVVHCLQVTGADCTVDQCDFVTNNATDSFLTSVITTATAFGFRFTNNIINMESTIGGIAVSDVAASGIEYLGDNTVIKNNTFHGEFSQSMIFNQTTAAEGAIITDNVGANVSTAAAAGAVSLSSNCTGMIFRNHFGVLETSTIDGLISNQACGMVENYFVNVEAETGGIAGTASG